MASPPVFTSVFIGTTNQQRVALGATQLQYERTQAWTMFAQIQVAAKPGSGNSAIIFSNVLGASPFTGYEVWIDSSGFLRVRIINTFSTNYCGVIGSVNVCTGLPVFVAVSYDGSSAAAGIKMYVNGVQDTGTSVEANTLSATIVATGQLFWIGNQQYFAYGLQGYMGFFSIDAVARSAGYIGTYGLLLLPPNDATNTKLYLTFDNQTGTTVTDHSASGFNATLFSATEWAGTVPNLSPVAFDTNVTATGAAVSSLAVTLTTAGAGELIYLTAVSTSATTPTIADTAGLTWMPRASANLTGSYIYSWAAIASTTLTGDVITMTGTSLYQLNATALSGQNPIPLAIPAIVGATTSQAAIPTTPNGGVLAFYAFSIATPSAGTGWTSIHAGNYTLLEYKVNTSMLGSETALVGTGSSNITGVILEAIASAPTVSSSNPTTPTISGTVQVGHTLTATGGTGTYQWYNEGAPISGATSATYVLQGSDQGCLIQVLSGGVFSALAGPVLGTTVRYVSMTDGLDTNDGTTSTAGAPHGPWKTLTHVNAQTSTTIPAGTSVLFKRGDTWRNDGCSTSSGTQLSPSVSGSSGSPIVFDAYGTGANPVFDGSYDLSTTGAWQGTGKPNVWQSAHQFNGFGHANGLPNNAADDPGNLIWGASLVAPGATDPKRGAIINASYGIMAGTGTNNIWFAPGASQSGLMSSGQWNFNTDNNRIQVYCVGNPATSLTGVNGDLRAAIDTCLIYYNQQSYLTFQNLTLNYSGASAIDTGGAGGSCNNIIKRDLVMQWIGGGNISGASSADSRYGDGIDIEGSCQNFLVERIWCHQIYDTGPGPQCGGGPHQDNITIRNNVCTDCGAFFASFFLGGTPTASGLYIYNNTVYCTQGCWSNYPAPGQRPNNPGPGYEENVFGLVVNTVTTTVVQSNMSIQNNIFAGIGGIGSSPGFGIDGTGWNITGVNASNPFTASGPGGTGPWLDYNCWPVNINGGGAQQIALHSGNYSMANWVKGTNIGGAGTFTPALEVHGIFGSDPLFTSQAGLDLSLQSGSSCRNAGANLYSSGVVWDFNKNPRPTSGAFTMGAFQ